MQTVIRARGLELNPVLKDEIERRVGFAVDRFSDRISVIDVHVADVNGPRGGVDKSCQIAAELADGGEIRISEHHQNLFAAVRAACDRLRHLIGGRFALRRKRTAEPLPGTPEPDIEDDGGDAA